MTDLLTEAYDQLASDVVLMHEVNANQRAVYERHLAALHRRERRRARRMVWWAVACFWAGLAIGFLLGKL